MTREDASVLPPPLAYFSQNKKNMTDFENDSDTNDEYMPYDDNVLTLTNIEVSENGAKAVSLDAMTSMPEKDEDMTGVSVITEAILRGIRNDDELWGILVG